MKHLGIRKRNTTLTDTVNYLHVQFVGHFLPSFSTLHYCKNTNTNQKTLICLWCPQQVEPKNNIYHTWTEMSSPEVYSIQTANVYFLTVIYTGAAPSWYIKVLMYMGMLQRKIYQEIKALNYVHDPYITFQNLINFRPKIWVAIVMNWQFKKTILELKSQKMCHRPSLKALDVCKVNGYSLT